MRPIKVALDAVHVTIMEMEALNAGRRDNPKKWPAEIIGLSELRITNLKLALDILRWVEKHEDKLKTIK
jgi:hypothetical protein